MFMLSILEDRIQLTKTGNRVVKPTLGLATQGHKLLTLATKDGLHVEAKLLTQGLVECEHSLVRSGARNVEEPER